MRNKFTIASVLAVTAILSSGSIAIAGPLETVGPTGTHATVQDAILAVDNGGVVEIVDGGTTDTLTGFIDLGLGPASYTIRKAAALAATEITLTNGSSGLIVFNDSGTPISQNTSVTIEDLSIVRTGGTGTAIDVDQSNPLTNSFTVELTLNNCIVEHTGTAAADNGEALKIDDGYVGGAAVTVNATDTLFRVNGAKADGKAAIRVQDSTWENLTVNLTDCIVDSVNYRAIRSDGGDNQTWNINGTTITALTDRAFQFDDPHNNCVITITDSVIQGGEEAIFVDEDGAGAGTNSWIISGSTIETVGTTDNTIRINYDFNNTFNLFNSIITVAENSNNSISRGVNLAGFDATGTPDQGIFIYNNTFVAPGTGGGRGISGSGMQNNAWNNLFLNFLDADVMAGSYGGTGYATNNNIIVGPSDDTSRGGNGAYISATAGLANALTAAGLDSNYQPLTGSAVLDAGAVTNDATPAPSNTDILTAIGNVDKNGVSRETPPDVGALELVTGSSVSDWITY